MNILGQLKKFYTNIKQNRAKRDRFRIKDKPFGWLIYSILATGFIAAFTVKGSNTPVFSQPPSSTAPLIAAAQVCERPKAGSLVVNPFNLRNLSARRPIDLTVQPGGDDQNCYLYDKKIEAPTLRIKPGEQGNTLTLRLTNALGTDSSQAPTVENNCVGGMPPKNATNLHFHGFNVQPVCHQDEVVTTSIAPNKTFEYKIDIPGGEPPGLYWYHPHVHMQSEDQVLSGLTGALVVEGIGKFNEKAAKLPERIFVLRDMNLQFDCKGTDCPAKDISINSVPIRFSKDRKYDPPAIIQMRPNQEQFWRVVNTAADTYFNLQVSYDDRPQNLEIVGMDGVPINADLEGKDQSQTKNKTLGVNSILLTPGGRAEFIVKGPGPNVKDAKFLTLNYDRNADNDPQRILATIPTRETGSRSGELPPENIESNVDLAKVLGDRFSGLKQVQSNATRTIYFSQREANPPDPNVKTEFYITEDKPGNSPQVYKMDRIDIQNVKEGTTEDWIIENRSAEAHAFHIHQIHFLVLESGEAKEVGMLRDTINLPNWDEKSSKYPSVKLRMDFRGIRKDNGITGIAGTFVFHCHILEHEDGGMMGNIQVKA
jgi:FtsP/CotA-like multicopper oxidase with cupredoxin domain